MQIVKLLIKKIFILVLLVASIANMAVGLYMINPGLLIVVLSIFLMLFTFLLDSKWGETDAEYDETKAEERK